MDGKGRRDPPLDHEEARSVGEQLLLLQEPVEMS